MSGRTGPGRWALAGVLAGALAVGLYQLPAVWMAPAVAQASGGRLRLLAVQGSLWQGSAAVAVASDRDAPDSYVLPGRLRWRLGPAWQRQGWLGIGVAMDIQHPCCLRVPARLRLLWAPGRHAIQARAIAWRGPANWLAGLGPPWNTVQPQGRLALDLAEASASWSRRQVRFEGRAVLALHDLRSPLASGQPLGSYRLTLSGTSDAPPRLELATLSGRLRMSGTGTFGDGHLRFEGQAQANPGQERVLANLLNLIGRRHGALSLISFG